MWMSKANPKRYVFNLFTLLQSMQSASSSDVRHSSAHSSRPQSGRRHNQTMPSTHGSDQRLPVNERQTRSGLSSSSAIDTGQVFPFSPFTPWLADRKKSGLCHISNGSLQQQALLCFIEFGYIQCGSPGNNRRRVDHISEPHAKFCEKRSIMKTEFAPLWNPNFISGFISNRI